LRPEALAVRFEGESIDAITARPVAEVERYFTGLRLHGRGAAIATDIKSELLGRLRFLNGVGLSYLSLDRPAPTLSGGEAQRIRLAAQLGSNLRGVCYILDEPTIGLHTRDNRMLLRTLNSLEEKGNTVVVVEHDEDTIREAHHIIDLGPGAGTHGGEVVASGPIEALLANPASVTGRFLAQASRRTLPKPPRRRDGDGAHGGEAHAIVVHGARLHNLRNITARFPPARSFA
jgi:excinuclease ABC subunit A